MNILKTAAAPLSGVGLIILGVFVMRSMFVQGINLGSIVLVATLSAIAVGLFLQAFWARRTLSALLLLVAVLLPFAVFSPFSVMDLYSLEASIPSVFEQLLWVIPSEVGLLLFIWLLDPREKGQPNPSLKADVPDEPRLEIKR